METPSKAWMCVLLALAACQVTDSELEGGDDASEAECGDDLAEGTEACDGTDVRSQSCELLGLGMGTLGCTAECTLDASACTQPGMVLVPAGSFEMGSEVEDNEQPIRIVNVDTFYIDEFEVTVAEYADCVAAGACSEPMPVLDQPNCNWGTPGQDDHPVNCVFHSWAAEYCAWLGDGRRLPTEAEWEKAARGTDARRHPWGESPTPDCSLAVMNDGTGSGSGCGASSTVSVGSTPMGASPYGAQDMVGSVWEWVGDYYSSQYDAEQLDNPTGPHSGSSGIRVIRGGGWTSEAADLRTTRRERANISSPLVGFRCAMPFVVQEPAAPEAGESTG